MLHNFLDNYGLRRRRRFWRFVSPRRRGVGLVVLAMLLAAFYGYWYITNGERVRRMAEQYLERLTGGEVTIHDAEFNLFGPIELRRVRLHVPEDDSPLPFLEAQQLNLRHVPYTLLSGRLQVTEIVCASPTVNLQYYSGGGNSAKRLFGQAAESRRRQEVERPVEVPMRLPHIRLLDSKLRTFTVNGKNREIGIEYDLSISLRPRGGVGYEVLFEEPGQERSEQPRGRLVIDISRGEVLVKDMFTPIPKVMAALPKEYRAWVDQYEVTGTLQLPKGGTFDMQRGVFEVELADVSMRPMGGNLRVENVRGMLRFDANGVDLRKITGRVPAMGGGSLRMDGHYTGFSPNSPFDIEMVVDDMAVPDPNAQLGPLKWLAEHLRETYQPSGTFDLDVTISRDANGPIRLDGTASPNNLAAMYRYFPYPVEGVNGTLWFNQKGVTRMDLTGHHRQARVAIAGTFTHDPNGLGMDVTVRGTDIPFDQKLTDALDPNFAKVLASYRPQGQANAIVHVTKTIEAYEPNVVVDIRPAGKASIAYEGFPYRLNRVTGRILIGRYRTSIEGLTGFSDKAEIEIAGTVLQPDGNRPIIDLTISASDVAIDRKLTDALDPNSAKAIRELGLTGRVKTLTARVRQTTDKPLSLDVQASLEDLSVLYEAFPYRLTDGTAEITFNNRRLVVTELTARHGKTDVALSGQVIESDGKMGVDLRMTAKGVAFDEELRSAFRAAGQEGWWEALKPTGSTDLTIDWRQHMPEMDRPIDYRIEVRPTGEASVSPRDLPLPFHNLTGRLIVTPEKVTIPKLTARDANATMAISGAVMRKGRRETIDLTVDANAIPLTESLLNSLPVEDSPLLKKLSAGGTFSARLKRFHVVRIHPAEPTTQPTGEADPNAKPRLGEWAIRGRLSFSDVPVDTEGQARRYSGDLDGALSSGEQGLAIDANAHLAAVTIGNRKATELRGKLVKAAKGSGIFVKGLSGRFYGGKLAGKALIRLGEKGSYSFRVSMQGVQLEKLVNAGLSDPNKIREMPGTVSGDLTMEETFGKADSRRATGEFRITKAKLYRIPLLLGLLQVVTLQLPGESAFNEGTMKYFLRGDRLVLREVNLSGTSLSIVGSGVMDLDSGKIKLHFLSRTVGKLPGIGQDLETLLKPFAKQIAEIEVTGTLAKPTMRTVALRSLDEAIRRLVSPELKED